MGKMILRCWAGETQAGAALHHASPLAQSGPLRKQGRISRRSSQSPTSGQAPYPPLSLSGRGGRFGDIWQKTLPFC